MYIIIQYVIANLLFIVTPAKAGELLNCLKNKTPEQAGDLVYIDLFFLAFLTLYCYNSGVGKKMAKRS
jgi:hypothetical protein